MNTTHGGARGTAGRQDSVQRPPPNTKAVAVAPPLNERGGERARVDEAEGTARVGQVEGR